MKKILAAMLLILIVILAAGAGYQWWSSGNGNKKQFQKSQEIFGNPLMGYAPCAWNESVREDVTLLYMDITWAELEPVEGKFAWRSMRKIRWQDGRQKESTWYFDLCVIFLETADIWTFPSGCMRKQGMQESGTIQLSEKDSHRIIVTNSFWLLIKKQ